MGFFSGIPRLFQESVDNYEGVLVPLAQARRHPTVEADYARRYSEEGRALSPSPAKTDDSLDVRPSDEEADILPHSGVWNGEYTLEGLRDEINADVAASGHDSSYDCECDKQKGRSQGVLIGDIVKSKVINKAIQDIGMGRYNWELFMLAGFGWFADK